MFLGRGKHVEDLRKIRKDEGLKHESFEAKMTYLGVKGHRPIMFREGNKVGNVLEVIKRSYELLPEGKKIRLVCFDSKYYR